MHYLRAMGLSLLGIAAHTLFLVPKGWAGEKSKVGYIDVFSLQIDRRETWDMANLGFNVSRYFEIGNIGKDLLYPGLGIRTKIGENPKVEIFPKIAVAGLVGGSAGGFYGGNGPGFGTSLWLGLEVIGVEYSFYSDKNGVNREVSIYAAYQFGSGSKGEYRFGNPIHDLASAFP